MSQTNKEWTVTYSAEGYAVIKHDDYGQIPVWDTNTAIKIASLLNSGPEGNRGQKQEKAA